jgi:ribosomal protein L31
MPAPYGYIRGTIGADGMQVDVYLGKHPNSDRVWVIDQDKVDHEGKNTGFDEHKVMLGYKKLKPALRDWLKSHFEDHGHEKLHDVVELSVDDFKSWLKNGKMKKPIAEQNVGEVVLTQKDMKKSFDTISTLTNLLSHDLGSRKKKKKKKDFRGPRWIQLRAEA